MNVEKELQQYRFNISRVKFLEKELFKLSSPNFIADSVNYYNSPIFNNPQITETNKFYSITESAGIKSAKLSPKIEKIKDKINKEIRELKDKIQTINILLEALDNQESFIIKAFYIEGLSWFLIILEYQKEFGNNISSDTLKRKRKYGLEKMRKILH